MFISKGIFDDSIIDVIKLRPDLMNVQVDVSSCDDRRNKIIEPGAPTYKERLKNLEKLSKIDGLASLVVRMDPLLPDIDDKEENITEILRDVNSLGVKEVVAGYMILTRNMKIRGKEMISHELPLKLLLKKHLQFHNKNFTLYHLTKR